MSRSCSRVMSPRSEEHTSELQSRNDISYAVFCLKKKKLPTGEVELVATEVRLLNMATTPPFAIEDEAYVDEALLFFFQSHGDHRALHVVTHSFPTRRSSDLLLPGVPEWLSPLVAVVPGQLAAMRLAGLRGVDLDEPLGLSKVTLTR